jgi:hypothetical protein
MTGAAAETPHILQVSGRARSFRLDVGRFDDWPPRRDFGLLATISSCAVANSAIGSKSFSTS